MGTDTSGLAGVMTYGSGINNTITNYYGGTVNRPKQMKKKVKNKSKKKEK